MENGFRLVGFMARVLRTVPRAPFPLGSCAKVCGIRNRSGLTGMENGRGKVMGLLSVIQTRLLKLWYYSTYKTVICLCICFNEKF